MHTTRGRILAFLKRRSNAGIDVLAQSLGLAPMTIRQHLAKMEGEGLVLVASERRPTGRPAHVYNLTPKGDEQFPKAYDRLAGLLLEEITALNPADLAEGSGEERRGLLMRRLAERAAAEHLQQLERLGGRERLEAATAIMREESGFVESRESDAGVEVWDYNCIYRRVADRHNESLHFSYRVRQSPDGASGGVGGVPMFGCGGVLFSRPCVSVRGPGARVRRSFLRPVPVEKEEVKCP